LRRQGSMGNDTSSRIWKEINNAATGTLFREFAAASADI